MWARNWKRAAVALILVCGLAVGFRARGADEVSSVRVYALNGGNAEFKDMASFSDTGEYDGKPGKVVMACFLIRHPKGTLMWDTGMGDKLAANKDGMDMGGVHITVPVTLVDQLKALGLKPEDVTYVAFSHFHADHTGNANLFAASTWILSRAEVNWAESLPKGSGAIAPASFSAYKSAKSQMIDGDYDVFGDGSVRILRAPGHTPGHQVLELRLKKAGAVILSGDLYHQRESVEHRRVPTFNFSRAETLASMDRISTILKNTGGRLVVQHDVKDFEGMPKTPAYLD